MLPAAKHTEVEGWAHASFLRECEQVPTMPKTPTVALLLETALQTCLLLWLFKSNFLHSDFTHEDKVWRKYQILSQLRVRVTRTTALLNGHGPVSSGVCRIFLSSVIHLEIKVPPQWIIPVLPNFFSLDISLEIFSLADIYFRRNIKKLTFI